VRLVDLSIDLDNNRSWAPFWARNTVRRSGHRFGAFAIWWLFRLTPRHLPGRLGWANDQIALSTHATTHLDAPWHYGPTSEGEPAKTIDRVPLEWCYGDGVVLDMRHKRDGEAIGVDDLRAALAKIAYTIKPLDIVLIRTGNDRRLGTPAYFHRGAGVGAAATRWILDRGVKVTGIDAFTWDVPLPFQARRVQQRRRGGRFWEAHYVGLEKEYCILERLTSLDQLPPSGFKVCCFPLKVVGGSAGPTRAVAIIDGSEPR
jgi:kynurenine formamidase